MATSPRYKIYRSNEYIGCCKYLEDAAAIAGISDGTQVRDGHAKSGIIWTEGEESISAGESFDEAANIMRART